MTIHLRQYIDLPKHEQGGFDHADVHLASGRVFVAHTALGQVDIIDGEGASYLGSIEGCPEASGVLCAQDEGLVFAAARAAGYVLLLDALSGTLRGELKVGPKPNGLAWDGQRQRLLAADVGNNTATLVDPRSGSTLAQATLPGRPRWCLYDSSGARYLLNIREPACLLALSPIDLAEVARFPITALGPHGLDLDVAGGRAFVACDSKELVVLDRLSGAELARKSLAGEPDVIWYNRLARRLYVASGQPGVVEVVDTEALEVVATLPTEQGAHTTAYDSQRQLLYVFLPGSCRAAVYQEV